MRELPPTAGLPLHWRDLAGSHASLSGCLARMLGVEATLTTCSGTAALVIALATLSADRSRHEVIVPAYTCPLVAFAVAHCGLSLRVCDLEDGGLGMDPGELASLCGPRTLAIVPTHLGGRVVDIDPARRCAARWGAAVIEDAAQALGARHADGTPAGMAGDIGFYSLAAGKGLSMYEGGALVSRHPDMHARMQSAARELAPARRLWELRRSLELLGYAMFYRPRGLSLVYGRPLRRALRRRDVEAAAGDVFSARIPLHRVGQWRQSVAARAALRLPAFQQALREQAQVRMDRLRGIPGLWIAGDADGAQGTWPVLMLGLPDATTRDRVLDELWHAGLGVGVPFARALPDYACLRGIVPGQAAPHARDFAARVLTIGNSPWLEDAEFARIVAVVEHACRGAARRGPAGFIATAPATA